MPDYMTDSRRQAYNSTVEQLFEVLESSPAGLSTAGSNSRLARFGANRLPEAAQISRLAIFVHQFRSPLIYILLVAAVVSLLLGDWTDAGFIFVVLLINATVGGFQEYSAQRAASALRALFTQQARVMRDGEIVELDAALLVPGDIVLIETGMKVPADLRLLEAHNLTIDESLLTGESVAAEKIATQILPSHTPLGDRVNMAFSGTMAMRGRGRGIVTATGAETELGRIASSVLIQTAAKAPLLVRMERLTRRIAMGVGVVAAVIVAISVTRGMPLDQVFVLVVAFSVSAIPEGLPVAITVALAIGTARMAKRNVIVRRLVAIEALGSCTCIASDKTGTLTVNQMTVRRIQLPDDGLFDVSGEGVEPYGAITAHSDQAPALPHSGLQRLAQASMLANEGVLVKQDGSWVGHGDAADVAMLVMAHKMGVVQAEYEAGGPQIDSIPYESERRYAASLNAVGGALIVSVKGAVEAVLAMCQSMETAEGNVALDAEKILANAHALAEEGYRVLAVAEGRWENAEVGGLSGEQLRGLTLLGLVGMTDPARREAASAIRACHRSGIRVVMITGDHPATAFTIGRSLGLIENSDQVATGRELDEALLDGVAAFDAACSRARVFSRVEARQKLQIVESLQRNGHFVAVTGDGVNDAPALKAAHVGVAMGKGGTDVARETAGIIITDDNFASIVAGIEEGRVAYNNIRKVIFLLISTGAAELVLFVLTLAAAMPFPLFAVQLLWLNLVTNGIQDVALAFEPAEGNEMSRPPRSPREAIFNRIMVERVLLSALLIGGVAFALYRWMLMQGAGQLEANNVILLLMVLFENVQVLNSRSESLSVFRHNLARNRLLLFGTMVAQLIHIGAMYTPGLRDVLHVHPVSFATWLALLALSLSLLVGSEVHKWYRARVPLA